MTQKYLPIIRNKDENGIILTYSVFVDGTEFEFNTLREAKKLTPIYDDERDQKELDELYTECDKLLDELK